MFTINSMNWVRFAILAGALGFSTSVISAVNVELALDNPKAPTVLVITKNSSQCDGPIGPILDCIKVAVGTKPHLFFKLKNACKKGGPQYKLSSFKVTQVNKVWPTVVNPLNSLVVNDFYADPITGLVDFSAGNNELKADGSKMKLKNFNSHEYTVFYEISAKHCTDSTKDDISLDPAIRNKG
jgi:hypothetical protein